MGLSPLILNTVDVYAVCPYHNVSNHCRFKRRSNANEGATCGVIFLCFVGYDDVVCD